MKRITISVDDDLATLVEREAEARGTSISEVVRTSLQQALIGEGRRKLPFAAICDDPALARGAAIDEALSRRWADDLDRDRR